MDDSTKRELFGPLGDVDPLPPSLLAPTTEQSKTLALLQEISRAFSPLVGHVVLLRTIAERIKRLVNYDVFSVMIWNEEAQLLQSVFSMRYEESIPSRLNVRLHEGLTGAAAGQRAPGDQLVHVGIAGAVADLLALETGPDRRGVASRRSRRSA